MCDFHNIFFWYCWYDNIFSLTHSSTSAKILFIYQPTLISLSAPHISHPLFPLSDPSTPLPLPGPHAATLSSHRPIPSPSAHIYTGAYLFSSGFSLLLRTKKKFFFSFSASPSRFTWIQEMPRGSSDELIWYNHLLHHPLLPLSFSFPKVYATAVPIFFEKYR